MTKYTITVDENTKAGKALIKNLNGLDDANDSTLNAVSELKTGKVTRCKSFDDYRANVK